MSSFQSKSELWVDGRKKILAHIKAKTGPVLRKGDPAANSFPEWDLSGVPAPLRRIAYKMREQYRSLTRRNDQLPPDQRKTEQQIEQLVVQSRFRVGCNYSVVGMLKERAGGWLIAWVKYMSIRGRSMSQVIALSRDAAACFVVSQRNQRPIHKVVETCILSREDQRDVLALLTPDSPFDSERIDDIQEDDFVGIAKKLCSFSEKDVDDMRHVYLPVRRGEGGPVKQTGVSRFLQFYHKSAERDMIGVQRGQVEFSPAELAALGKSPTLEAMEAPLRAKCLLVMPISYKNRTLQYAEVERANPAFRQKLQTYANRVKSIDPQKLTFVDETSLVKDAHLSKGWGPVGGPSLAIVPKSAGMRTAIWSACTTSELYTLVLPPTSRVIGNVYRSLGRQTERMRTISLLRSDPMWGLDINTYLNRVSSIERPENGRREGNLFSLPVKDMNLMELAYYVGEEFRAKLKGVEFKYKLVGDMHKSNATALPADDPYYRQLLTLADGLKVKSETAARENSSFAALNSVDIMNLAHADFLLREKCAKHNRYQERAGSSKLFGSGRLGLERGRFDEKAFLNQVTNYSLDPVFEENQERTEEEEEEEELLMKDEAAAEPYVALFHLSKRLWIECAENPVSFARFVIDLYQDAGDRFTGNRRGDVFQKERNGRTLLGRSQPDYATAFSDSMATSRLSELIDSLFDELGIQFKSAQLSTNMQMARGHKTHIYLKSLALYMLATSQNSQVNVLTLAEPEVLSEEEMKERFPVYRDPQMLSLMKSKPPEQRAGAVIQFIFPPYEMQSRPVDKKRADLMEAESTSVSSNQHLFREFLRSLPPSMVEGHTVVLDNASYHGGLRKADMNTVQSMCIRDQVCFEGKDLRAELSEEARELRERGAGRGVPVFADRTGLRTARKQTVDRVKEFVSLTQPALLFLPPYCPQLNPIETVFAVLKQRARRILEQAPQRTRKALTCSIHRAAHAITKETLLAEFRLSGYLSKDNEALEIDASRFLSNAGILGYILRRIDKEKATPRPPAKKLQLATPDREDVEEQVREVKSTVQTILNERVGENGVSQAAKNILMRAYNLYPKGQGLDRAQAFTEPVRREKLFIKRPEPQKQVEEEEEEEEEEQPVEVKSRRGRTVRTVTKGGQFWKRRGISDLGMIEQMEKAVKGNTSEVSFTREDVEAYFKTEDFKEWFEALNNPQLKARVQKMKNDLRLEPAKVTKGKGSKTT